MYKSCRFCGAQFNGEEKTHPHEVLAHYQEWLKAGLELRKRAVGRAQQELEQWQARLEKEGVSV